jgi:tRNA nucleotidyltransferase (CCA-adding enzyme)
MIKPETTLKEALRLMQRYGYEGFPVELANHRVAGLLTRRAVDRAIAHNLNLSAGSLMEAGEVFVSPEDSIDRLRDVMARSGWGQIPVFDAPRGEVVGIVTRTDLLKQLGERPGAVLSSNYAKKLEAMLPPSRLKLLQMVAAEATAHHLAIYIVGGFVRDLILSRPGLDFDMVVEGDAIALAQALQKRFGGHIAAHSRFGTAKWSIAEIRADLARELTGQDKLFADLPDSLDMISARTEFYDYPTALPTVERSSIKLDLHRRDFSINTFALRLDGRHYGELYDYWGGMRDLREGCIRVLHSLSFVDDPTRQLRAVRFEQRFGFKIDNRTLQLMQEGIPLIRHLSGERLRHELDLVLQEDRAIAMLYRLGELGLLQAIHPDLPELDPHLEMVLTRILKEAIPPEWDLAEKTAHLPVKTALAYLVWLIELPADKALLLANHIRLPGALRDALAEACSLRPEINAGVGQAAILADFAVSLRVQRLDRVPLPALYALYISCADDRGKELIRDYVLRLRKIWPYTSGSTLRELGLTPGPVYKNILVALRSAWLDGVITSRSQETSLLKELMISYG